MKESNTKLLGIIIGLLIIVNLSTLSFFWITRKNDPNHQAKGGDAAEFLIKELAFDSVQVATYRNLIDQHRQAIRNTKREIEQEKQAYFALLSDTAVSEQTIKESATRVSVIEQQVDLITFHHLQKVRSICSPSQQKKFDEIIIQVIRMMGRQGPPPPRRGNGDVHPDNHPPEGEGFPPPPDSNGPPRQ